MASASLMLSIFYFPLASKYLCLTESLTFHLGSTIFTLTFKFKKGECKVTSSLGLGFYTCAIDTEVFTHR